MISRFFIDRPIFATVLSALITLVGGIALVNLPMAQYPRITPPGIAVTINYPGASAPVVADTVAAPIEQQVNGIDGMLYMSSQMGNDGSYTLTVTFDIGTDVNTALVMVQNRVALALPQLPTEVQNQGITIRKKTPDMLMIVNFFSRDDRYDDIYLSNFATIYVKDELLRVYGVSDINYLGQRDYSIRAWLNPQKLAALNMTAMDVANAIRNQNLDAPSGRIGQAPSLRHQLFQLPVDTLGRLTEAEQFENIVVKVGPSGPRQPAAGIVRLRDVARVELGAQNYNQSCTFDGHPSVGLSIYQLPGTNALDVADRVRAKMEELKKRFPEGVDYDIAYDTTPYIRESVGEVFNTLRDAVILVGLVVLLFLQDWKTMILPMIDVPVSLIGTFAVMAVMGFTRNNLTLFGLVLAIGIVVDDAIVVLENTERMIAKGYDARTATIKAMEEITGPILAITLALSAVFVPCCFLGGITGQFFRQFAVTIAVSTIISAVNALTMTPSRAVLIFKTEEGRHGHEFKREALPWWIFGIVGGFLTVRFYPSLLAGLFNLPAGTSEAADAAASSWWSWGVTALDFAPGAMAGGFVGWCLIRPVNAVLGWLFRGFNRLFDGLTHLYGWTVGKLMRISVVVLLLYGWLLVVTYQTFQRAPTGFIPQQDQGRLIVNVQLPDSASLERTKETVGLVAKIARETPGVAHMVTISGLSFLLQGNASNFGSMFIVLSPFDQRKGPGCDVRLMSSLKDKSEIPTEGKDLIIVADVDHVLHFRTFDIDGKLVVDTDEKRLTGYAWQIEDLRSQLAGLWPPHELIGSEKIRLSPAVTSIVGRDTQFSGLHADFIMPRLLREYGKRVKDGVVSVRNSSPIPGLGVAGGFKIMVEDRGGRGLETLQTQTDALTRNLRREPGLADVATGFRSLTPQLFLDVDRKKVESLGVSFQDVNQTLSMYLGSLYVNSFNEFGRHWQVTVQAQGDYRNRVEDINLLQVRNKSGQMVPLGTLVNVRDKGGPIAVTRYNLYTAAPITGNMKPGVSSGDAIDAVTLEAGQTLPLSMKGEWTELMYLQIRAGKNTTLYVFALAIVFVFLALAALYESWALPLAVILVVPMCLLFSVSGVLYTRRDVNIFVQIGLVVLVGLACKNAILIVEFAKQKHQDGLPRFEAIQEACRLRLRPILMTSFAFIVGVIPLTVASGAGAEMRRSLGIAVFSGMLGVTLFGIFLTPVFFSVIQGLSEMRAFTTETTRWAGSAVVSGFLGLAFGFLLAQLGVLRLPWALAICGPAGVLAALAVLGFHRTAGPHRLAPGKSFSQHPESDALNGDLEP
ncbi:MAG: efflux RND transporter permease subunit [Isosphaeraceae bacterium]